MNSNISKITEAEFTQVDMEMSFVDNEEDESDSVYFIDESTLENTDESTQYSLF